MNISGADAGVIALVRGGEARMIRTAGLYPMQKDISMFLDRGITARVVRERQSQLVMDVASDPDYVAIIPETRAQMSLPSYLAERLDWCTESGDAST